MGRRAQVTLALALAACGGPAGSDAGVDAGAGDAGPDPSRSVVAPELADAQELSRLADLTALPVLDAPGSLVMSSSEDRMLDEEPPIPLLGRGNQDMNHFVCRGANGDLRQPNLAPMRFDTPECPEPYARGAVLARVEGSGALIRFWATLFTIMDAPPDRERLIIWVDDDPEPVVDVPLADLLAGSPHAVFAPPFGAGSDDFVAWYYPVVFGSKLLVALDGLGPFDLVYHQTLARLTDGPRVRAPAPLAERDEAIAALEEVPGATPTSYPIVVPAGGAVTVADLTGPGTIRALTAASADAGALQIRVTWDGAATPAIDVPLLELFAAGLDPPEGGGGLLDSRSGAHVLRLPMPFTSRAHIEVENRSTSPVTIDLTLEVDDAVPTEPFGNLHVERRETVGPTTDPAHLAVDRSGRGRLAGLCLMMEGRAFDGGASATSGPLSFLEGDERIVIDGAVELTGTGTEDYLDSAFYFAEGPHATPFSQAWGIRSEGEIGRTSACRWHVRNQTVDFESSLRVEIEIGPGDPTTLERYRTVAFLYEQ